MEGWRHRNALETGPIEVPEYLKRPSNLPNRVDAASTNEEPHTRVLQTTLSLLAALLNRVDVVSTPTAAHVEVLELRKRPSMPPNRVANANKPHNQVLQTTLSLLAALLNRVDVADRTPHIRVHVDDPKAVPEVDDVANASRSLMTLRCQCWAWMVLERDANLAG